MRKHLAFPLFLVLLIPNMVRAGNSSPGRPPSRCALPLIEMRDSQRGGDSLAVIISGAGGWAPLVRALSKELAAHGLPVVGVDAMRYFWQERTPEQAADDLALVLQHYLAAWSRQKAVLIGYSMGAEVLPFLFNRLPPDLQLQTAAVVLIGPGPMASFEFHLVYLLGVGYAWGERPVHPEVLKMGVPVFCVFGREEKASVCGKLPPYRDNLQLIKLPGGHHFNGDYRGLAEVILRFLGGARPNRHEETMENPR